ncbi:MAG TPA: tetratricopeptide repeat protein [Gemmataceae bacterium]|nr:tetratricopeptide repeat protein [Gemmataceae bacterium]
MSDALSLALRHHQRGQLDDAARLYQSILAEQPDHADALHLLGVVALQRGNPAQAVELIGRAVARNPRIAAYHSNLADAYRVLGQFDQAISCGRRALLLKPDYPEAANHLGLALQRQGNLHAAAEQFRTALRLRPRFGHALNNLGNVLRLLGDRAAALDHYRRAVEIDPNLAGAHTNLGQLLLEQYQLHDALSHFQTAVRLRPDLADVHNNLGHALRALGRLAEARQSYAQALRLNPGLAMTYNNMGQARQEENALDDARTWYERALRLEPKNARFHCSLGRLLLEQQNYDEAWSRYGLALQLDPAHADTHFGLGAVRHAQGQLEEAQAHYQDALHHKPDFATALFNLGAVRQELGDLPDAERCWREALSYDPHLAIAHSQLALLLRGRLPEADLTAIRQLLANPNLRASWRRALLFGLGQVLDARGAYPEAAELLQQANSLAMAEAHQRGQAYAPAAHRQLVRDMIAVCSPEFFARVRGFGLETERPIFIVGLPRSGTTLTEQILAGHSQVFGAGELRFAREDFESLGAGDSAALAALSRLDHATAQRLAGRHMERLRALNADKARVVDKMPENFVYLGLLAALFPRAKFIHCRRDLCDTAASCWVTDLLKMGWSNDPDYLASYFEEYVRIMDHWRQVLPVPLLEVDYEETVAELERVARRLVDWCGLEWEPACLAFHEVKRPVRTASAVQVRQPVSAGSVGRWKNYEQSLAPLFARLKRLEEGKPKQPVANEANPNEDVLKQGF